MKILHVDSARAWRGGQTQLLHLLGPGVHVALPADAALGPAAEASGAEVHRVDVRWRGAPELRRVIERVRPDVVAAHTSHAHDVALLAGARPIVHRRNDFRPGTNPLNRLKYAQARGYVAVSAAVARVLVDVGVPEAAIAVVHDGVDALPPVARAARSRIGVPLDAPLVAAVGALVPHKGHEHLVDAMGWIDNARQDVWCVIAGDGPLRADLQARIDRYRIGARTVLLGQRDDVGEWLGAADVFAHPSVEEGLGQAVIEAMLADVPVVASNAGGLSELVRDLETGLLVAPGDGAALSRAIVACLRGPERARERARAAHAHALGFGVARMVADTLAAYEKLR